MKRKRIVLASSGDRDSLAAIARLVETSGADVVTLTVDVGQDENASSVRERALAAGAAKAHVLDARDEFAREYLGPLLHAGALRRVDASVHDMLVRMLIAEKLADVGAMEGAEWVAHGFPEGTERCLQFESAVRARWPECLVRSMSSTGQASAGDQLQGPAGGGAPAGLRVQTTLWGRSVIAEHQDPGRPGITGSKVVPIDKCPAAPAFVEIAFAAGQPVAINRVEMPFGELIEAAATIAGDHGIGRSVANKRLTDGVLSTEVLEAPALVVLAGAYEALARSVLTPALFRMRRTLAARYADLVHRGQWHSDVREALDLFMSATRSRISGAVRLRLHRGRCRLVRGSTTLAKAESVTSLGRRPSAHPSSPWPETTPIVSL